MKRLCLFFTISIISIASSFAQTTTNGTGGGLWSSTSTWAGGVVPTSGDIVIASGDSLQVDGNFTVGEIIFNYRNSTRCTLRVKSGNTLNCQIIYTVPTQSNATANIIANGSLNINQGGANRDLRITGSNIFFNLTNNIVVPSGGQLVITDQFKHVSLIGSDQNHLFLTTVGKFQCKAFSADFGDTDDEMVLDVNGDFDYTTFTINLNKANSSFNSTFRSSADVDGSNAFSVTSSALNNAISLTTQAGSDWRSVGFIFFNLTSAGDYNNVNLDVSGAIHAQTFANINSDSDYDTINYTVRNGGLFEIAQYQRYRSTAGANSQLNMTVENGGSHTTGQYWEFYANTNGSYNFNISGNMTLGGQFGANYRSGANGNFTVNNGGLFSCTNFNNTFQGNGKLNFTNNGSFSASGFNAVAIGNDTLNFNYNTATTINGTYLQSITGSTSKITSNVANTLTIQRLNYDINTTGLSSNNTVNINRLNANLNLTDIVFTGSVKGTLTGGGVDSNSTLTYTGSGSGDSVITSPTISYYNLTINKPNGIALIGPLNSTNLKGNMTINGGAQLNTSGIGQITVQKNYTNNGTVNNNSARNITILGNYTNTGAQNHSGGNYLIGGNFSNTGTFQANAGDTVKFNGASGTQLITGTTTFFDIVASNDVTVSSGTSSLQRSLQVTNNKTFNGNGNMIFLSNTTGTASLKELTGTSAVSGNFRVQRFLNEGVGYYMLGSPVSGSTLADWNNELTMSGFPGSNVPANGVSVYKYLESGRNGTDISSGYRAPTNVTNSIDSTFGWFVYLWSAPQTVDVVGPLRTGSFPSGTLTFSNIGPTANRGWHLRANPYASPVTWANVTKNNIQANEAYVRRADDGGNYWAVNADGINNLYSGEAFFVQVASAVGGSITFDENDKVVATDGYNNRAANPNSLTHPLKMELTYSGKANYMDYSVLRFGDNNSTINFDGTDGEARKLASSVGTVPNIASWSHNDSSEVYYNSLNPEENNVTIPLKVWTLYPSNVARDYTINFNGIEEWVKNNHCLILHDTVANVHKKLDQNFSDYTWNMMDNMAKPRIFLEHTLPLTYNSGSASCFGYSDGTAEVTGYGSGTHSYTWFDNNGNIVKRDVDITGPSTMNTLAAGEYTVFVSDNGACGEMATTFEIKEPEPIIADFSQDMDTVWLNANATVYFTNASINADSYDWDFGDGTSSTLESPSHTYTSGGEFKVRMIAIDGACSDTLNGVVMVVDNVGVDAVTAVNGEAINIYQMNNETFVELNFAEGTDVVINMFDVIGRNTIDPVNVQNVKNKKVRLNVPDNIFGVYTIQVITPADKVAKKIYYARK